MARGLLVGFLVWFFVRILFRFTGHWLLADDWATLIFGFCWMAVNSAVAVWFVVRWFCPSRDLFWPFGVGLVVPGLFGDAAITMAIGSVYPNIGAAMGAAYGSWMLFGYGVIMASLLVFGERAVKPEPVDVG